MLFFVLISLGILFFVQAGYSQKNIKLDISGKTGYFDGVWSTHNFTSDVNLVISFKGKTIYYIETLISTMVMYYIFKDEDVTKEGSDGKYYHIKLGDCDRCDNRVWSFDINLNNMQLNRNFGSYSEIWYISNYELLNNSQTNEYLNSQGINN